MQANVLQWLDQTACLMPDKTALCDEQGQITYGDFRAKSLAIARTIISKREDTDRKIPIVVYLEKSLKVITSFMGIAYSGGFYSPIDVDMPASRADKILEVLKPRFVITTRELQESFSKLHFEGEYILYDEVQSAEHDEEIVACQKGCRLRIGL